MSSMSKFEYSDKKAATGAAVYRAVGDNGRSHRRGDCSSGGEPIFRPVFRQQRRSSSSGTASAIAVGGVFLAVFLVLFAVVTVVFLAVGHRSVATDNASKQDDFEAGILVTGASMSPTLWGQHAQLTCSGCQVSWKIHWQARQRPREAIICWNCGDSVAIDEAIPLPGDRVLIRKLDSMALRQGVLVAVAIAEEPTLGTGVSPHWTVKRVAALPGQTISHQNGWLFADANPLLAVDQAGQPLWIAVHDDSFRKSNRSWWKPGNHGSGVEQTPTGFVFQAIEGPTAWLDYQHFAVHDSMRPDVVRDDVASNATEVRALMPVDSLGLTFNAIAIDATEVEVAWRIGEKSATVGRELPAGESLQRLNFADAAHTHVADASAPPISIRLRSGQATLTNIVVWRPLRYRIDPRLAAKQTWPIGLNDGEYYLLGDNVPLSIDSRDWGPIPRRRIVGRIDAVGYDVR